MKASPCVGTVPRDWLVMARLAMLHLVHHPLVILGWSVLIFTMESSCVETAPVLWWVMASLAARTIVPKMTRVSQELFATISGIKQSVATVQKDMKGTESSARLLMTLVLLARAMKGLIVLMFGWVKAPAMYVVYVLRVWLVMVRCVRGLMPALKHHAILVSSARHII